MKLRRVNLWLFLLAAVVALAIPANSIGYHYKYPPFVRVAPAPTVKLDVPFHKQEHKLSCEAATLRMLLLARGIDEPEDAIIAKTPFGPMGDDPDFVFVGSINGRQNATGYGIHWDALSHIARTYAPADSFHRRDLNFLIDRLHEGNAVIIWGSLLRDPPDASWTTPSGKFVPSVHGEHTWVVTGYSGPRRAPTHIFTLDPLSGERVFRTGDFLQLWSYFNNSGVFLL